MESTRQNRKRTRKSCVVPKSVTVNESSRSNDSSVISVSKSVRKQTSKKMGYCLFLLTNLPFFVRKKEFL